MTEQSTGLIAVDAGGISTRAVVFHPPGQCLGYAVRAAATRPPPGRRPPPRPWRRVSWGRCASGGAEHADPAGRFTQHHAFLTRVHLDLIDHHTRATGGVTARIEVVIEPFQVIRDMIVTIPGVSTGVADVIIAETGADMTRFPTGGLASRAGK
jgi:hypothetical protein